MEKKQPIHQIRISSVKASIWENATETGIHYNVTFSRLYKDGADWKFADSFGRDDLLVLAKVSDQAHTYICDLLQNQE